MNILKVFFPAFVQNEQREESITFYEELFDEPYNLRFLYPEGGLKLASYIHGVTLPVDGGYLATWSIRY